MSNRSSSRLVFALVAIALGTGLAIYLRPHPEATPAHVPPSAPPATGQSKINQLPLAPEATPSAAVLPSSVTTTGPESDNPAPSAAPLPLGEAAQEAITELVVTYEAASVPALARYLSHSDPDVRAAARDGFIQMGERAAIPFLEAAAKTAPADEAKALREAAEFLALPTWTEHRAAQKKAAAEAAAKP